MPHATSAMTNQRMRYNHTMGAAIERTRALLTRRLGVEIELARGEAYREAEGLAGDWIGAFAQPGVILNAATVVRATIVDGGGRMVDEYGEATLTITRGAGDRVELRKQYAGRGMTGQFVYVGRRADGMLAGYWYSPLRPAFCGVFWLARADRLSEATRTALDARVRSHSFRRDIVYVGITLLAAAMMFGAMGYPMIAAGAILTMLAFRYVLLERTDALRREMLLWKRELT